MIQYLNLKKHKALNSARLTELGNINVICGKNNSGKTTILEALSNDQIYSVGKKLDNAKWLIDLFIPYANGYNDPSPEHSINWFRRHAQELVQRETIWYSDDRKEIIQNLRDSQKQDSFLRRFSQNIFNFDGLLNSFFSKSIAFYKPVLIPPKRQLEFQSNIELMQEVLPAGMGIINRLFYLKNQDLESSEYETYKKIYDTFSEITGSKFNVVPDRNNKIALYYNTDGSWIPASDSGLGLSDVLIIISVLNAIDANVFLVEEPENHLHADYQKRLLKYLRTQKLKQFFITTHSSVFLDTNTADKIFYCANTNGEITLSDQTSKSEIIHSLGYSITENLVADLIVLLEGPTDIPVIREMLNWFEVNTAYNIKFWPLGGDIMASLDLSVFAERSNVFALVDSDTGSSVQRTRFIKKCEESGIYCMKLERYSIENYFPLEAIRYAFPDQVPNDLQDLSPNESVDVQIGFKDKDKTIKARNSKIVKQMKISDIEGTDLYTFLEKVKLFLTQDHRQVLSEVASNER